MSMESRPRRFETIRFVLLFVVWMPVVLIGANLPEFRTLHILVQAAILGVGWGLSWFVASKVAQLFVGRSHGDGRKPGSTS